MTRDEMIEKLEGLHAFIYSVSSHGEKEAHDTIRAVIAALRAPAVTGEPERAWLIECHRESVLHYWTGRVIGGVDKGQWSHNIDLARRFARREDAECMLTWHLAGNGRVAEHLWPAPVASPPAVTGEAARHARTLLELSEWMKASHKAACLAGADALAAPPAAGAPPALVALVQRAQKAKAKHTQMVSEADNTLADVWYRELREAVNELLAWSPAPAPVAPPAETCAGCGDLGVVGDYATIQYAEGITGSEAVDVPCPDCQSPAPPAVAGGDAMPEIQVGDTIMHGRAKEPPMFMHRVTEYERRGWQNDPNVREILRPIWRQRREGQ